MPLIEIVRKLKISDGTVWSWKNRYNWDNEGSATLQKKKCNVAKKKKKNEESVAEEVCSVLENTELNEKYE